MDINKFKMNIYCVHVIKEIWLQEKEQTKD